MSCCTHCRAADALFDAASARKDVARYRRRGPDRTTRLLLTAIRETGLRGASLLDIGAGVGVIQHELLGTEVASATHVEASSASIDAARAEGEHRGNTGRVDYLHGDFVDVAARIAPADIVTLDRVICCYPDVHRLVTTSVEKARSIYAFSIPRDRWYVRVVLALENLFWRLRGSDFRTFVHPVAGVEHVLTSRGFLRRFHRRTLAWHVALFVREAP